jgi:diacylglycerol kinase family enzyme
VSTRERAFVLLNARAGGGSADERYARLRSELAARFALDETSIDAAWREPLARALAEGTRVFLAAGGDGTVHALINALVELGRGRMPAGAALGAIGLGSSNDFHKPVGATLQGLPVRIDLERARPHDLVLVRHRIGSQSAEQRWFLVSASLGITAKGNALFNRGDAVLRRLKRRSAELAIDYTVLRALLAYRPVRAEIGLPDERVVGEIFNLSVTKRAHVTGGLRYEGVSAPDSGRADVFLAADMRPLRRVLTLLRVSRGRFSGAPGTHHWAVPRLSVRLARATELELDGEIVLASEAEFEVVEKGAVVCG